MKQYNAIWPLPGGVENYFDALITVLRHIKENEPLREQMIEDFKELFPTISKTHLVRTMLLIPVHLGYAEVQNGKFGVTDDGLSLLQNPNPVAVYHRAVESHIGFQEIVDAVAQTPLTTKQIHAYLKEHVNQEWTHHAQPSYRTNWLRSLGIVEKDGMVFKLTERGKELASKNTPPKPTQIVPAASAIPPETSLTYAEDLIQRLTNLGTAGSKWEEFENAIAEAFEFLGFASQKVGGSGEPDVVIKAPLGPNSYTVVIDAKASSNGNISQNQVNLNALHDHKAKTKADYVAVVAVSFSGGNLLKWSTEQNVRLIDLDTLGQIIFRHESTPFSLIDLKPLFQGGGALADTDIIDRISLLADEIEEGLTLPIKIFKVILAEQNDCGAKLDQNALYFLLEKEHEVAAICDALNFLKSPVMGAIIESAEHGLTTCHSMATFRAKLNRLAELGS